MKGHNYMTKAKAMELMLEYSRSLIDPALARKIAKAFGYTLSDLGLIPKKTKDFYRANYTDETASLTAISNYQLAQSLAEKFASIYVQSSMHGIGSMADDITEKSVNALKEAIAHK